MKNRLNGCLAVSRSLGDYAFRTFGLSSSPDIKSGSITIQKENANTSKEKEKEKESDLKETGPPKKRQKIEKYKMFILCSDGFDDLYPNYDEVKNFVIAQIELKGVFHLPKIAEQIVRQEFRSKEQKVLMRDNTSFIMIAVSV